MNAFAPPPLSGTHDGRRRVVVECVAPQLEDGRHPIKRTLGEQVLVEADVFADGHEGVSAVALSHRLWRRFRSEYDFDDFI